MKSTFPLILFMVIFFSACKKDSQPKYVYSGPPNIVDVTVSTVAGINDWGNTNGTVDIASFNFPNGVAVDASGNLFVSDYGNNQIREISAKGIVSTFAGSGVQGSANGTGAAASFFLPAGVAVDVSGNVYVADAGNNLIRKITPTGVVSTLAGSGIPGQADGMGTTASFSNPTGVAVDASGNIYVADAVNNLIRKISPAGLVTTIAGNIQSGHSNGMGKAALFNLPCGIAVDGSGDLFIADVGNNLIREISPGGVVSTLAGSGELGNADGIGTSTSFAHPTGVSVDVAGNVYVADSGNDVIREINPYGIVITYAGDGSEGRVNGGGKAASFNDPIGLAVDASEVVYVADSENNLIRKIVSQLL